MAPANQQQRCDKGGGGGEALGEQSKQVSQQSPAVASKYLTAYSGWSAGCSFGSDRQMAGIANSRGVILPGPRALLACLGRPQQAKTIQLSQRYGACHHSSVQPSRLLVMRTQPPPFPRFSSNLTKPPLPMPPRKYVLSLALQTLVLHWQARPFKCKAEREKAKWPDQGSAPRGKPDKTSRSPDPKPHCVRVEADHPIST
ncbi:hypothetical protein CORC01_05564 [Colletotrichum orchidophilum]|uniref:Uncharacterized protein n=1 Tax=Colletotrichum orchidophilum TaxID=1209926 RepID=A0A1G4BCM2_9PEZI|nr:uncharacterized protein CORC01_05564 [Colletotrichum orchidophilum]OHE99072.1 hypothetical protein CORC01_05564 [Colletotrichum orchidophilum]